MATAEWERLENQLPRASHGFTFANETLFTFGGIDDTDLPTTDTANLYQFENGTWRIMYSEDPKPSMRYSHEMVSRVSDGLVELYVFGGSVPSVLNGKISRIEHTNELWLGKVIESVVVWRLIQSEGPSNRSDACAMLVRDGIYVFGGIMYSEQDERGYDNRELWRFDVIKQTWKQVEYDTKNGYAPRRYSHHGGVYTNENDESFLVIFGGKQLSSGGTLATMLNDVWMYSLEENMWSKWGELPYRRMYQSFVIHESRVWMYGGFSRSTMNDQAYVYGDVVTIDLKNTSDILQKMITVDDGDIPNVRFMHRAVMWKDSMVIHGGRFNDVQKDMWRIDLRNATLGEMDTDYFLQNQRNTEAVLLLTSGIAMFLIGFLVFIAIFKKCCAANGADEEVSEGLSAKAIKEFPIMKYKPGSVIEELQELCPICLVEFTSGIKVRQLPCDHNFHPDCIDEWLISKSTCPMCKYELTSNGTD